MSIPVGKRGRRHERVYARQVLSRPSTYLRVPVEQSDVIRGDQTGNQGPHPRTALLRLFTELVHDVVGVVGVPDSVGAAQQHLEWLGAQSVVISGHQRSSVALTWNGTLGTQWSSVVISGHHWSSVVISGHPRSSPGTARWAQLRAAARGAPKGTREGSASKRQRSPLWGDGRRRRERVHAGPPSPSEAHLPTSRGWSNQCVIRGAPPHISRLKQRSSASEV